MNLTLHLGYGWVAPSGKPGKNREAGLRLAGRIAPNLGTSRPLTHRSVRIWEDIYERGSIVLSEGLTRMERAESTNGPAHKREANGDHGVVEIPNVRADPSSYQ